MIDLNLFKQAKEIALGQRADAAQGLEDLHPLHAACAFVTNTLTSAAQMLLPSPELSKIAEQIAWAEEQYLPDGPPMSPITRSWYTYWTLFDLMAGAKRETLGTCVAAISKAFGSHPGHVEFIERLCATRPGIYLCEGVEGDLVVLRELVTDLVVRTLVPSGYSGRAGDMLLLRLMLPWHRSHPNLALAVTTPYQIIDGGRLSWLAYFDRTLSRMGGDRVQAYEALMKYGAPPHGARYWTEYLFEAYVNFEKEVVFLRGLPDVAESRPHASVNQSVRQQQRPPWARIVKTLPMDELRRLPKMSETLIEFGATILGDAPPACSAEELNKMLQFITMTWNLPLFEQHGEAKSTADLQRQMHEISPRLPPQTRQLIDRLMQKRTTLYGYDPRIALPRVVTDGKGYFTVTAESRLLGGLPPGWNEGEA